MFSMCSHDVSSIQCLMKCFNYLGHTATSIFKFVLLFWLQKHCKKVQLDINLRLYMNKSTLARRAILDLYSDLWNEFWSFWIVFIYLSSKYLILLSEFTEIYHFHYTIFLLYDDFNTIAHYNAFLFQPHRCRYQHGRLLLFLVNGTMQFVIRYVLAAGKRWSTRTNWLRSFGAEV